MLKSALIVIVTMICSFAIAGERVVNMRAVISEQYPSAGAVTNEKDVVTFLPGVIVSIDRVSDDGMFHVWGADGSTGSRIPHQGVWLPKRVLATERDFRKHDKWDGDKQVALESPDMSFAYTLASDGGVKAELSGNDTTIRRGHLYGFKNLLWIKVFKNERLLGQNVFLVLPNGKLCSRNRPEGDLAACPGPGKK